MTGTQAAVTALAWIAALPAFLPAASRSLTYVAPGPAERETLSFPAGKVGFRMPFEGLENGRGGILVLLPLKIEGRTFQFLLDSGASSHAVSMGVARRLGLERERETKVRGVGSRDRKRPVYRLPRMQLGSAQIDGATAIGLDLRAFGRPFGVRIGGILGGPLFRGNVIGIDYARRRFELIRRKDFRPPSTATEVPFRFVLGVPVVEARVDGREKRRFKIDTGNALSLILYAHYVKEEGLLKGDTAPYPQAGLGGAFGTLRARTGRIRSLALGRLEVRDVYCHLVEPHRKGGITTMTTFAGNLGSGFLRSFILHLDYSGRKLWLARPDPRLGATVIARPDLGMELIVSEGRVRVRHVAENSAAAAAGIRTGDQILNVAGREVHGELGLACRLTRVERSVELRFLRAGRILTRSLVRRPYLSAIRAPGDRVIEKRE